MLWLFTYREFPDLPDLGVSYGNYRPRRGRGSQVTVREGPAGPGDPGLGRGPGRPPALPTGHTGPLSEAVLGPHMGPTWTAVPRPGTWMSVGLRTDFRGRDARLQVRTVPVDCGFGGLCLPGREIKRNETETRGFSSAPVARRHWGFGAWGSLWPDFRAPQVASVWAQP